MGGKSTAGTSASEAMMRSRMPCAKDSFHDSHGYTPLWQVSTSCQRGQQVHNSTYRSSFATSISRTSSPGAPTARRVDEVEATFEPNLEGHPQLASSLALPVPALYLYAGHDSHACCPPLYAEGALDMSTFHPERAVSSPAAPDAPRGPVRSQGGAAAVGARQQVLAQQVLAMSSTPRDVSGLLDVLLVLNDVLAHPAALHLFAFVSKRCGTVLHARSVMSVNGGAA